MGTQPPQMSMGDSAAQFDEGSLLEMREVPVLKQQVCTLRAALRRESRMKMKLLGEKMHRELDSLPPLNVEFLTEQKHSMEHNRNVSEAKKLRRQAVEMSVSKVVDLTKATKGSMSPSEQLNNMQIRKDEINDKITNILHKLQNKSSKTKHAPKSQVFNKHFKYFIIIKS